MTGITCKWSVWQTVPPLSDLVDARLLEHSDSALTALDEALALLHLPELIALCKVDTPILAEVARGTCVVSSHYSADAAD